MPRPRKAPKRSASPRKTKRAPSAARRPPRPSASEQRAFPIINADPLARVANARDLFWNNILREMLANLAALSAQRARVRLPTKDAPARTSAKGVASSAGSAAPPKEADSREQSRDAAGRARRANSPNRAEEPSLEPDEDPELEPAPEESSGEEADDEEAEIGTHIRVGGNDFHPSVGRDPGNLFDGRLGVITSWGQRIPIAEITPVFACGLPGRDKNWLSTAVECTVFEITTPAGEVFTLPVSHIISFHSLSEELVREIQRVLRRQRGREGEPDQPFGFAAFTSLARSQGTLGDVPEVPPDSYGGE